MYIYYSFLSYHLRLMNFVSPLRRLHPRKLVTIPSEYHLHTAGATNAVGVLLKHTYINFYEGLLKCNIQLKMASTLLNISSISKGFANVPLISWLSLIS